MIRLGVSHPGPGVVLVEIRGELDVRTSPELRELVEGAVSKGERRMVIDLNQVDYLDSTGLGALVRGARCINAAEGELQIVCETPRIRRIMEIAGLTRVLALCGDRTEAFQRLGLALPEGVGASAAD